MTRAWAWLKANPVIAYDVLKFVIAGGVALGWWATPDTPVSDLGTAVGALAFGVLTAATHRAVQPVSSPSGVS